MPSGHPMRQSNTSTTLFCRLLCCTGCALLFACDGPNTPLDAVTRQTIDSIATAEIRLARVELDSLCQLQQTTVLPLLVDSIKQKRLQEIQQQLKTIPK